MSWTRHAEGLARRAGATLLAGVVGFAAMPLTALTAQAARSPQVHVIVRGADASCAAAIDATLQRLGGRMLRPLHILNGGAATLPANAVSALAGSPCVTGVTPDGTLAPASIGSYDPTADTGSLYNTTLMTNAQRAWRNGFTGKGVGVALIDTGVAPVQGLNAPGQVINGPDLSFDSQAPALTYNDEYGHGTHLAGIIAGNDLYAKFNPAPANAGGLVSTTAGAIASVTSGGRYAGDTSDFIGMAPDAHVINMKVGDENGVVDVSQVIAAIDWVVQHANDPGLNIKVINLSYGTTSSQAYTLDPLAYATEVAWRSGITVVAAAGNGGNASASLNDPAYDPFILSVGAADTMGTTSLTDDVVASFSNAGDGTRNPDLVAPGVHIESLRVPGSNIDLQNPGATVGTRFFLGSGTSQAAAVVSGALALYFSAHPGATPNYAKKAFWKSASPLTNQPATTQGNGEVNVMAAINRDLDVWAQRFTPSTGTGTLEGARGNLHVTTSSGVVLSGERDIMGNTWDSAGMATAEGNLSAWNGGTFNGAAWSGAGWSGAGWSGAAWSGAGWSGAGWSGAGWSGSTWNGAGWSGAGWSGAGWSGAGWSGAGWSGAGWSGAAWSGAAWSGAGWSDYGWS